MQFDKILLYVSLKYFGMLQKKGYKESVQVYFSTNRDYHLLQKYDFKMLKNVISFLCFSTYVFFLTVVQKMGKENK